MPFFASFAIDDGHGLPFYPVSQPDSFCPGGYIITMLCNIFTILYIFVTLSSLRLSRPGAVST